MASKELVAALTKIKPENWSDLHHRYARIASSAQHHKSKHNSGMNNLLEGTTLEYQRGGSSFNLYRSQKDLQIYNLKVRKSHELNGIVTKFGPAAEFQPQGYLHPVLS